MIYFRTNTDFDLNVIRLQGVSIKPNAESIGFFGTGLKYAIAIILRNGGKIFLMTAGERYEFSTRTETIRGKPFERVYMNDEGLSFTLDYGKNWKMWQAFRELHSNTLDEGGVTATVSGPERSIIEVAHPEFESCYEQRAKYFIEGTPRFKTSKVDAYEGSGIYYRSVLVHSETKLSFAYNIKSRVRLTEDRTLEYLPAELMTIAGAAISADDPAFLTALMDVHTPEFQYGIPWDAKFSEPVAAVVAARLKSGKSVISAVLRRYREEFPEPAAAVVAARLKSGKSVIPTVLRHYREEFPEPTVIEGVTTTPGQERLIARALKLCALAGIEGTREEFKIVAATGRDSVAYYDSQLDMIAISVECLSRGTTFLAATLFEEFSHKIHGYADESRAFQQFLIDTIIGLTEQLENI